MLSALVLKYIRACGMLDKHSICFLISITLHKISDASATGGVPACVGRLQGPWNFPGWFNWNCHKPSHFEFGDLMADV